MIIPVNTKEMRTYPGRSLIKSIVKRRNTKVESDFHRPTILEILVRRHNYFRLSGDCIDDDHTLEGATTAVGVNGEIYCAWAGHYKLYFDKSLDGGKTWGKDKVLFDQESGWAMDIPHLYRSNGMPFIVVDNSNSKYTGRLYLVWGDDKHGDADIFMRILTIG